MAEERLPQEKPARVRITYPLETESGAEERELPFVIGILADLFGHPGIAKPEPIERKFIEINRDNFAEVLAAVAPRLKLEVENSLDRVATRLRIELHFRSLADFEPMGVVKQVVPLRGLLEERNRLGRDHVSRPERQMSDVDRLISDQLDEILHTPDFQRLEASWRCVHFLVFEAPAAPSIKIRIFDVNKKELLRDQQRAKTFDQSTIFKKVYDDEYGAFRGEPYGVLIGDYDFGPKPEDVQLLKAMAKIASTAHAPFLAAASPGLLGTKHFSELSGAHSLYKIFESPTYAAWRSFRDDESSRYAGLVLPRVLMRQPYLGITSSARDLQYDETADATTYLWGNPAYLFAARLANSFALHGWFEGIAGFGRENLIPGLPTAVVTNADGVRESATDIVFTEPQARELSDLGFIPLVYRQSERAAAFHAAPSCGKPVKYIDAQATADAGQMVQLRSVFAASLIARYIKVIVRDKAARLRSASSREEFLNSWIRRYVMPEDIATGVIYPLRDAWIEIQEHPRQRSQYFAVVFFRPRFGDEEIKTTLRVAVPLP